MEQLQAVPPPEPTREINGATVTDNGLNIEPYLHRNEPYAGRYMRFAFDNEPDYVLQKHYVYYRSGVGRFMYHNVWLPKDYTQLQSLLDGFLRNSRVL